jgi:hypothetical protein
MFPEPDELPAEGDIFLTAGVKRLAPAAGKQSPGVEWIKRQENTKWECAVVSK